MNRTFKHLAMLTLLVAPMLGMSQDKATDKIHWMSLEEAVAATKKAPKPIMMDVYTDWCGPCRMMMAKTFTHAGIIKYVNEHYYAVKFNAEGPDPVKFRGQEFTNPQYDPSRTQGRNGTHQLTYAVANVQGRVAYPTIVYMDNDLEILAPVQGYLTPEQIEPILVYFGDEHYKTEKDFAKFRGAFVSTLTP